MKTWSRFGRTALRIRRARSALALSFDRPASAGCYASWHPTILGNLGDNFLDASDGRGRQAKLLRCTLDRWARYPGMKRRRLTHKLTKPQRVFMGQGFAARQLGGPVRRPLAARGDGPNDDDAHPLGPP